MRFSSFVILILLFLSSCEQPDPKLITSAGDIAVDIQIFQEHNDKNRNEIMINLFNKDNENINNKEIKIKVNNKDVAYEEHQELYYVTTNRYHLSDLKVNDNLYFEITLTDGQKFAIGSVKPIKAFSEDDIVTASKGDSNKDFVIKWNGLTDVNKLNISKSNILNNSTATEINTDSGPDINETITANGNYTIPKSYYRNKDSKIDLLILKFIAEKNGTLNPKLLKNSKIQISSVLDRVINFN